MTGASGSGASGSGASGSGARVLDPTILREYDIRGVVETTLSAEDVGAIGRSYGSILARSGGKTVAVGYDGRLSSPELEAALVDGLISCGLTVYRVGLGPTPMLYYATHALETDGGMMVTGSHNPPEYNGIKMVIGGKSFYGEAIQELGRVAAAGDFVVADDGNSPRVDTPRGEAIDRPIIDEYVARLFEDFDCADADLTIAWDAGNGSAGDAMQMLVERLPGRHVLINETIDGTFPAHHPDPTVESNLQQLKDAVAAESCDLGIAFDGDGDRIGVIDGQGRVLWGDQIMVLLAREVLKDLPGATIIADVKASQVFFDEIERMGGKPLMWKTGHSLIKSKMAETGSPLAGEMSAHIFFAHRYYGYDDALYAAVRLISIVGQSGQSLADLRDELPNMINTPELRFDCDEARKFAVIEDVRERLKSVEGIEVNDIDGVRVLNEDGWWLLRASNTQAVLVARCESKTEDGLDRLKATLVDQLTQSGIDAPDFN